MSHYVYTDAFDSFGKSIPSQYCDRARYVEHDNALAAWRDFSERVLLLLSDIDVRTSEMHYFSDALDPATEPFVLFVEYTDGVQVYIGVGEN